MKFLLLLTGLLWHLVPAVPVAPPITTAQIRFQISNAGLKVDGTLSGLEANIQFDPAHPELARIQASVPVSSIKTGIALRDKHLQKPDYFDAERYPTITVQSKSIRKTGQNQYEGVFALTIKGTTRDVKIPFTVSAANELRGELKLNRLDFNVGKSSIILSDNVTVSIRATAGK